MLFRSVDAIDQGAAFDLDVEPRPLLDGACLAGVLKQSEDSPKDEP